MLKSMNLGKAFMDGVLEKLVHPSLVKRALLKLPFANIEKGCLNFNLMGDSLRFEGKEPGYQAELMVLNPFRAWWLLKTRGQLGFAQAYYEGAVDTNSLHQLMHLVYQNRERLDSVLNGQAWNVWHLWQHRQRHNSVENSRRNISFHYDLGNAFYLKWLDSSMTYSSGLYLTGRETLEQAQKHKYRRILEQLELEKGHSVLEIGCGWGGWMETALKSGATIKGLTLSSEQQKYAMARLLQSFPQSRFEVRLQDYRYESDRYDRVVSVEMFEAVGKEYWPQYFGTLKRVLKPGGKAVLQVITIDEAHAERYQKSVDFIQAYIFPGGLLPSTSQLSSLAAENGFEIKDVYDFGADYAKTCQSWKQRFNRQSEALETLGYDKAFQRLWNYYLDYCIVGFETGHISVCQVTLTH